MFLIKMYRCIVLSNFILIECRLHSAEVVHLFPIQLRQRVFLRVLTFLIVRNIKRAKGSRNYFAKALCSFLSIINAEAISSIGIVPPHIR